MKGEHVDHYTSLVSRMNLSSMDLCVIDIEYPKNQPETLKNLGPVYTAVGLNRILPAILSLLTMLKG